MGALLLVSIQLALYVDQAEGMGICFGGGYPACCQGKNTCGPLCASCSRVSEFLRMMMMFGGIGPGTPDVFRTINPDPHKDAGQDAVPFPSAPFPQRRKSTTKGARQATEEPQIPIGGIDHKAIGVGSCVTPRSICVFNCCAMLQ